MATLKTIEIATHYPASLSLARRLSPAEKNSYAEWCRDLMLVGVGDSIEVSAAIARKIIGDREADGMFPGCENQAWIITDADWDKILQLSAGQEIKKNSGPLTQGEIMIRERYHDDHADDDIKNPNYCHKCHSYCYGDCVSANG